MKSVLFIFLLFSLQALGNEVSFFDFKTVSEEKDLVLHRAILENDLDRVKFLLDNGVDLNLQDKDGWAPLHIAIHDGKYYDYFNRVRIKKVLAVQIEKDKSVYENFEDEQVVLDIIKSVADIDLEERIKGNEQTIEEFEFYLEKIQETDTKFEIVKLLLEKGADPNIQGDEGWTAVHVAAIFKFHKILELLLESGADSNIQTSEGETALHGAAYLNLSKSLEILLKNGADVNIENQDGLTPLDYAITEQSVFIRSTHSSCKSSFKEWSHKQSEQVMKIVFFTFLLFSLQALGNEVSSADSNDSKSVTAEKNLDLHFAILENDLSKVKSLLKKGADPNLQDKNGWTPLHTAIHDGKFYDYYNRVLYKKPLIMQTERYRSFYNKRIESEDVSVLVMIKDMFDFDFEKAIADNEKAIAEMELYIQKIKETDIKFKIAKLLLKNGADPTIQGNEGWTAVHTAALFKFHKTLELFLDNGADVNVQNDMGETATHVVAYLNLSESLKILLENGADVNIENKQEATPLDYAIKVESLQTADLLFENGAISNYFE